VIAEWKGFLPISGDVVIVEDDPVLRSLMADILRGIRAKCVTFESADDALMHVLESHGKCGLLITDHGVPGQIDGTELSHMFRAKWPDIPVILTSGYELELGTLPDGVAYLRKPWTMDSLIQTVGNLLQPDIPVSRA
jgi:DNA-binding NtrC family response regulator